MDPDRLRAEAASTQQELMMRIPTHLMQLVTISAISTTKTRCSNSTRIFLLAARSGV